MSEARAVIEEFIRRMAAGEDSLALVAEDFVNHEAGPQGREGFGQVISWINSDLGDPTYEVLHIVAEGELAVVHLIRRGRHQHSTMPLLTGVPETGRETRWTFMHLFRVSHGLITEHWACRDDVGLLAQLGAWPPPVSAKE